MNIPVMGAGVTGVTTAYQLLKDGHEVVVVEQPESAGNAGRRHRLGQPTHQPRRHPQVGHNWLKFTTAMPYLL